MKPYELREYSIREKRRILLDKIMKWANNNQQATLKRFEVKL